MKQVFRSTFAVIVGWVWMAFAAFNAVDLVVRYGGRSSMVAAAVLAVLTALVFLTCLRPALVLSEEGVLVRNPLRNTFVPWRAVDGVTVSHSITIVSGERKIRCWVPHVSARERAAVTRKAGVPGRRGRFETEPVRSKGERAAAEAVAGRTHADWVAQQITERAEAARRAARARETTAAPAPTGAPASGTAASGTMASGTAASTAAPVPGATASESTASEGTASTGAVPSTGVTASTGDGTGAGAPRTTWAPTALAALAVAALPTIAAFLV
ncbi:PH domain-containing protein [Streptosporangium sp. NPDC050855]|uniref:PH domain-containing protein n=1 Tax=Streptosporangium sp. NPDC050855 TaxID=3366194 RepID=UPI0037A600D6